LIWFIKPINDDFCELACRFWRQGVAGGHMAVGITNLAGINDGGWAAPTRGDSRCLPRIDNLIRRRLDEQRRCCYRFKG
jgi:hypothetical protein